MDATDDVPDLLRTRVLWINASIFGIVIGLLCGAALFVCTNILVVRGGPVVGPHLALIGQVFIGYRVTFVGSLIGFGYGAGVGFVFGYVGARLYNKIAGMRERWSARRGANKPG